MAKTANLNIRIDPKTKEEAEKLFQSFGITLSDAVNIFLNQSLMENGLPFEMKRKRYNATTEAALEEAELISKGLIPAKGYNSVKALFEDLDIEC